DAWLDADVVAALNAWVYQGGAFIGVNEPSAVSHGGRVGHRQRHRRTRVSRTAQLCGGMQSNGL
ncbi:MAG: lacto-N-biose phosphorylase central domain-containing protein, partial [Ruthenibacterium sp.]